MLIMPGDRVRIKTFPLLVRRVFYYRDSITRFSTCGLFFHRSNRLLIYFNNIFVFGFEIADIFERKVRLAAVNIARSQNFAAEYVATSQIAP